ncbi:unnamed protein product [Arctia plantaginis]|uniref:Uncharacterized protein n=1 Tax=Arctia plantaginis TaxID=874455 RepID=A0A8S0Z5B1_ARCPL|nr:unnamed protein product [Arctia plantaginis]CAB3243603.1 unnamed protein product [Arctia plantaginis]
MSGSRDSDWVPVVAGIVVGAGVLTIMYMLFRSKPEPNICDGKTKPFVRKYKCKCLKNSYCHLHNKNENK